MTKPLHSDLVRIILGKLLERKESIHKVAKISKIGFQVARKYKLHPMIIQKYFTSLSDDDPIIKQVEKYYEIRHGWRIRETMEVNVKNIANSSDMRTFKLRIIQTRNSRDHEEHWDDTSYSINYYLIKRKAPTFGNILESYAGCRVRYLSLFIFWSLGIRAGIEKANEYVRS